MLAEAELAIKIATVIVYSSGVLGYLFLRHTYNQY
jgi:hypothetical protein